MGVAGALLRVHCATACLIQFFRAWVFMLVVFVL